MSLEQVLAELKLYLTNPQAFPADRVYAAGKVGTFDLGAHVPEPLGVPENDRLTYDPDRLASILGRLKGYTHVPRTRPLAVAATRAERRA
jgi:hypothetical protein